MDLDKLTELREELERRFDDDIERLTPKDRLTVYLNLMEFFVPKMQRANFQVSPDDDQEMQIFYYGNESNPKLSGTLDGSKKS